MAERDLSLLVTKKKTKIKHIIKKNKPKKSEFKNVYNNFAQQALTQKPKQPAQGLDPNLQNPVDAEVNQIKKDTATSEE